jgi:hypothetical protein
MGLIADSEREHTMGNTYPDGPWVREWKDANSRTRYQPCVGDLRCYEDVGKYWQKGLLRNHSPRLYRSRRRAVRVAARKAKQLARRFFEDQSYAIAVAEVAEIDEYRIAGQ